MDPSDVFGDNASARHKKKNGTEKRASKPKPVSTHIVGPTKTKKKTPTSTPTSKSTQYE